jgi:hypothetical protein
MVISFETRFFARSSVNGALDEVQMIRLSSRRRFFRLAELFFCLSLVVYLFSPLRCGELESSKKVVFCRLIDLRAWREAARVVLKINYKPDFPTECRNM